MTMHFEELWEKCENFYQETKLITDSKTLLEELDLKMNLYRAIDSKEEIPAEEKQKAKSRLLGEILLTLTGLSLKDNVNVFEALSIALQYRSSDFYFRQSKT
jgi:hypothetical protein